MRLNLKQSRDSKPHFLKFTQVHSLLEYGYCLPFLLKLHQYLRVFCFFFLVLFCFVCLFFKKKHKGARHFSEKQHASLGDEKAVRLIVPSSNSVSVFYALLFNAKYLCGLGNRNWNVILSLPPACSLSAFLGSYMIVLYLVHEFYLKAFLRS